MRHAKARRTQLLSALFAAAWLLSPRPAAAASADDDLTRLSLNELLSIEVTSVSRHAEPLSESAAAVFVLSADDIRRAGAHSIAEALRLVPGLDVAQVSAQSYAISARGFNSTSADKLQVLLDGRSVYTPLFSGVFWDVLDTDLGDVDRIEVIRGPGAALWGSNAVNGVINIITRNAHDTQGSAVRLSAGTVEHAYGTARQGFAVGDGAVRIYAQGVSHGSSALPTGGDAVDGMRLEQTGFRSDWNLPHRQNLTVSGDAYTGRERSAAISGAGTVDARLGGGNLLARWSGATAASDWSLQAYYDGYTRDQPGTFAETRNTADLDFQQGFHLNWGVPQNLLYGLGYRYTHDDTAGPPAAVIFSPPRRSLQTGSAFVQDQFTLSPEVELTLGGKFESSTYASFEAEPSVRLGWRAAPQLFAWGAVSRAVRLPNRLDEDIAIYCPPPNGYPGICAPGEFRIGNPQLKPNRLIAYETGTRWWPTPALSLDLALFYNHYTDLRSNETTPPPFGSFANSIHAASYGGELSLAWQPLRWLSVRPWYQWQMLNAEAQPGSTDLKTEASLEGSSPKQQAGLRLGLQPWHDWQFDLDARYVGRLPAMSVPDYAELNLRAAWTVAPHLELALSGQNLLDARHAEWGTPASRFELRRGVMFAVSWGLR